MAGLEGPLRRFQHEVSHRANLHRLSGVHHGLAAQAAAPLLWGERRERNGAQTLTQREEELNLWVKGEPVPYDLRLTRKADLEAWRQAQKGARNTVLEPLSEGE